MPADGLVALGTIRCASFSAGTMMNKFGTRAYLNQYFDIEVISKKHANPKELFI